jgi:anti-sigma factor RsiW
MTDLSCDQFVASLGDYVEGLLSNEARRAFVAHRDACAACRQTANDYERLPARLRRETDVRLPESAAARIRRGVDGAGGDS